MYGICNFLNIMIIYCEITTTGFHVKGSTKRKQNRKKKSKIHKILLKVISCAKAIMINNCSLSLKLLLNPYHLFTENLDPLMTSFRQQKRNLKTVLLSNINCEEFRHSTHVFLRSIFLRGQK